VAEDRALKIATAAFKAQQRIEEQGGLPDIHVPGMETPGGGGNVSASQYVAEAMGISPSELAAKARPKVVVETQSPRVDIGTGRPPAWEPVVGENTGGGVRIGSSYGRGHTAKVIRRVMSEEKRVAEGRPAQTTSTIVEQSNRPGLDVDGAMNELRRMDRGQIEYDTALSWGSRAVAAYTLSVQSPDRAAQAMRFGEATDYETEAREHAAQVPDNGKLLRFLSEQIAQAKESALANLARPDFQR
jgi:hypothetical protein